MLAAHGKPWRRLSFPKGKRRQSRTGRVEALKPGAQAFRPFRRCGRLAAPSAEVLPAPGKDSDKTLGADPDPSVRGAQTSCSRLSSDQSGNRPLRLARENGDGMHPRILSFNDVRSACQEGRNEILQIVKRPDANSRQALFSAAPRKWKRDPPSRPGPWSRKSPRAADKCPWRRPAWP